jgi:hypothetical protein
MSICQLLLQRRGAGICNPVAHGVMNRYLIRVKHCVRAREKVVALGLFRFISRFVFWHYPETAGCVQQTPSTYCVSCGCHKQCGESELYLKMSTSTMVTF